MRVVVAFLAICLGLSLCLNVYLWGENIIASPSEIGQSKQYAPELLQNTSSSTSFPDVNRSLNGSSETQTLTAKLDDEKSKQIFKVRQWIAAAEYDNARDYILDHLREYPRDIDFLLLEAELISKTNGLNYTLAHFYQLLDLALSTEQRADVIANITALASDNISKLMSIRSWDILETFVEPLWQFDPTRKSFILALAESYAWQNQESLMENVLASLPRDDIDAKRIRRILLGEENFNNQDDPVKQTQSYYDRIVRLQRYGDHFITDSLVGRTQLRLMIDTGASTTVITRRAFNQLGRAARHDYIGNFTVNTAGGQVDAPIYRLKQLFLGGFRLEDIAVVVLPMPDFKAADGLLGMNFLREFDFKIDQKNETLMLKRL